MTLALVPSNGFISISSCPSPNSSQEKAPRHPKFHACGLTSSTNYDTNVYTASKSRERLKTFQSSGIALNLSDSFHGCSRDSDVELHSNNNPLISEMDSVFTSGIEILGSDLLSSFTSLSNTSAFHPLTSLPVEMMKRNVKDCRAPRFPDTDAKQSSCLLGCSEKLSLSEHPGLRVPSSSHRESVLFSPLFSKPLRGKNELDLKQRKAVVDYRFFEWKRNPDRESSSNKLNLSFGQNGVLNSELLENEEGILSTLDDEEDGGTASSENELIPWISLREAVTFSEAVEGITLDIHLTFDVSAICKLFR